MRYVHVPQAAAAVGAAMGEMGRLLARKMGTIDSAAKVCRHHNPYLSL